jgi:hypothetical protein
MVNINGDVALLTDRCPQDLYEEASSIRLSKQGFTMHGRVHMTDVTEARRSPCCHGDTDAGMDVVREDGTCAADRPTDKTKSFDDIVIYHICHPFFIRGER